MASPRESPSELAEDAIRLFLVITRDVVGREVIECVLRPDAVRVIGHESAREAHVRGVITERACGREVEESRLRLARPGAQIRLQPVSGGAVTSEVVVALGEAERHQLAIVVRRGRHERGKRRPGLGPAARREEALGPAHLQLDAIGWDERRCLEPCNGPLRHDGLVAERELVVHAVIGLQRARRVSGSFQRGTQAKKHF